MSREISDKNLAGIAATWRNFVRNIANIAVAVISNNVLSLGIITKTSTSGQEKEEEKKRRKRERKRERKRKKDNDVEITGWKVSTGKYSYGGLPLSLAR